MSKYDTVLVRGYWKDDGTEFERVVAKDVWDGTEDDEDEEIFFYCDGSPVLGDHGDFVLTHILDDDYEIEQANLLNELEHNK